MKPIILNSTMYWLQAAIEEGVVIGGGCCLLRLSMKIDVIKKTLENEEQKVRSLDSSIVCVKCKR